MDRVLLDTNIVLDLLSFDRPNHKNAQTCLEVLLDDERCEVIVSASSLNDAYFILCRHYEEEAWARDDIRAIRELFTVAETTTDVIDAALMSNEPDFEDGLIRACAEKYGASCIISRDRKAFCGSHVPRREPSEFHA